MRVPHFRFTVRRIMVALVLIAISLHLALTARRVQAQSPHLHLSVSLTGDIPDSNEDFSARVPFWSRYWRCLLGLDGRVPGLCPEEAGRLVACELEQPEICSRLPPGTLVINGTPELSEQLMRFSASRIRRTLERERPRSSKPPEPR